MEQQTDNKYHVLIVDDVESRHVRIKDEFRRAGINTEFRSRSGPDYVSEADLSWAHCVWLDHDMCQRGVLNGVVVQDTSGSSCPSPVMRGTNMLDGECGCKTGMDLAKRMVESKCRPVAVVHTANNIAGPEMYKTLEDGKFSVFSFPASVWGQRNWGSTLKLLIGTRRGTHG